MKTVHKYRLNHGTINPPEGFKVLHVGMCKNLNELCAWLEVNTSNPHTPVTMQVFGTGHPIPDSAVFLQTVQEPPFVWHKYLV